MGRSHDQSGSRWAGIGTESRNVSSAGLDSKAAADIVELVLQEDGKGLARSLAHTETIARAAQWLADAYGSGGLVLFAGAGTSGRLGVLEAAECPPTFGTDPERIRAVIAGGAEAVFRSREGAEDRDDEGREAVAGLGPGDLLIALSASAVTPFVGGALAQARDNGARTVLITCAAADSVLGSVDLLVALDTGAEVLTGSTRLKAGSATKAVLNALTTAAMVQLGKVFENWMVDLQPGSAKLRDRAQRIVAAASGLTSAQAARLLERADGEVKTAIVMARLQLTAAAARERLRSAGGHVRRALS